MNAKLGFTLVELTIVIVVVGLLAVFGLPKIIDLRSDSYTASVTGLAGAFATAAAVNDAACQATNGVVTPGAAIKVAKCSDPSSLIKPAVTLGAAGASIANTYNLLVDTAVATNGLQATCTLQYKAGSTTYTATYVVIGACN